MKVYQDRGVLADLAEDCAIQDHEKVWMQRYPYLLSRGYKLDDRYDLEAVPSWLECDVAQLKSINEDGLGDFWRTHPDALPDFPGREHVREAIRTTDGRAVFLKLIPSDSEELAVMRFLSSHTLVDNPKNPAAQLLDVFPAAPDDKIYQSNPGASYCFVVIPLLLECDWPPHATVGEVLRFIRQILEGVAFLHQHNVAHGDIRSCNIMMDPSQLFPYGVHPKENLAIDMAFSFQSRHSRLDRVDVDVRYHLVDFGSSSMFAGRARGLVDSEERPALHRAPEMCSAESSCNSPAELEPDPDQLYDPFMADMYALGCFLDESFAEPVPELVPLIQSLKQPDPTARPMAEICLRAFNELTDGLSRSVVLRFMPNKWETLCAEAWLPESRYMRFTHFQHVATYMRTVLKCIGERSSRTLVGPGHDRPASRRHSSTTEPSIVHPSERPGAETRSSTL